MRQIKQRKFWLEHYHDEKYQAIRDNISESFKDLVFYEEPHKYYLGERELMCVSNVTHMFQEHFDSEAKAQETYERHFNDEDSKYYQMTPDQILEMWKNISGEACETGTNRHNFGESVFWWSVGEYENIVPEFLGRFTVDEDGDRVCNAVFPKEEAILEFWNDLPDCYIPILAENKVYNVNDEYAYSGTFDILFYYDALLDGKSDELSGCVIMDYKTNKDLYKNFKEKKLISPFSGLLDMPLNIYKLQLAAYQLCVEKIGIKVIARRLLWLRPDGRYIKVPLEDLSRQLHKALLDVKIG